MDFDAVELIEVGPADRTPLVVEALVGVWRASVEATHDFLADGEVDEIAGYVPQALAGIERLVVALGKAAEGADSGFVLGKKPLGFMGVQKGCLEMLFLAPEARGHGLGGRMLRHGIERLGVRELTVNEENPSARGFYEHLGFSAYERSEKDDQGGDHPILRMRIAG